MERVLTLSKKEQNRLLVLNEAEKGKMGIREVAGTFEGHPIIPLSREK